MTASTSPRSLLRRPLFWVVMIIWLSVLCGLWAAWPYEPRFTFQADIQILGITRDSRKLLALTNRATAHDETNSTFDVETSGPLQVWDLKTGSHRSICLPNQACTGKLVKCQDGFSRMLEPDGSIVWSDELFRGHFLLLPMIALVPVGWYARTTPRLGSFPFFIWYQMLLVFFCAACTSIAYVLVKKARPLPYRDARTEDLWFHAATLYQGDFLPQLEGEWVADYREMLNEYYLEALVALGECARARRDQGEQGPPG